MKLLLSVLVLLAGATSRADINISVESCQKALEFWGSHHIAVQHSDARAISDILRADENVLSEFAPKVNSLLPRPASVDQIAKAVSDMQNNNQAFCKSNRAKLEITAANRGIRSARWSTEAALKATETLSMGDVCANGNIDACFSIDIPTADQVPQLVANYLKGFVNFQ